MVALGARTLVPRLNRTEGSVESNPAFMKDFLGLGGVHLGPYIVQQVVTMGGVAVIYRGEHETLHNAVAVKVLTPEVVQPNLQPTLEQLFLREAQILSQLRSDDILRAHHHGRVVCPADGIERSYLVVDWLEGRTLGEELDIRRVQRRPYTLLEVVELLEPIARALAAAHAAGIVHRDVNPRNVFLENMGPDRMPRAKLIDFGFAKQVAQTQSLQLQRVAGTLLARSPDYSAPEHYDREEYGELSENTDIYTFALMVVEALTLEPPLRGTTPEALRWSTTNRLDRPTPRRRGAQVSDEVEELFAEALAVDQFDRPGSILDWWQRVKHATLSSMPAPPAAPVYYEQQPAIPSAPQPYVAPMAPQSQPYIAPSAPQSQPYVAPLAPQSQPFVAPVAPQPPPPSSQNAGYVFDGRPAEPDDIEIPGVGRTRPNARWFVLLFVVASLTLAGGLVWWRLRPVQCGPGLADCNGDRADGCETNLSSDVHHCGTCQAACPTNKGAASCVAGQCKLTRCESEYLLDCNQSIADGCETDSRSDVNHCGDCTTACGSQGTKQALCAQGKCQLTCRPGAGNCDTSPANGCETNLNDDAKNCGRCGFACIDTTCEQGVCAPQLVTRANAEALVTSGAELYFVDAQAHTLERVGEGGKREVLVSALGKVTGLAIGSNVMVWATSNPAQVFARAKQGGAPERLAGPLTSDTPLVSSSSGWVAWANRSEPPTPGKPRAKNKLLTGIPEPQDVLSVAIDRALDKGSVRKAACEVWPRTFAADDGGQYCCTTNQPLLAITCAGATCTTRKEPAVCPDAVLAGGDSLYLAQDTRIFALAREHAALRQLVKRKRRIRELRASSTHLYWLEGDASAEVWRAPKDGTGSAELIARHQAAAASLAVTDRRVYWVAEAPASAASAPAPGGTQAAHATSVHRAIYALSVSP